MDGETPPALPRIWLDLDGCFADFHAEALNWGIDVQDPDCDRKRLKALVRSDPEFWYRLRPLPGYRDLWAAVARHNPAFLTGGMPDIRDCCEQKRAWVAEHIGPEVPCVVVWRNEKSFYARPGDILIDDLEDNILRWERAGGIGILHVDVPSTLVELQRLGIRPDGTFGESLLAEVARRRADKAFRRKGYTGYRLTEASQKMLASLFRPHWFSPESRISCHHITRSYPAADDVTFTPRPEVRIVGEFRDEEHGCHTLVAEVDGEAVKENGEVFHVTLTYDRRLGASRSKVVLDGVLERAGGDRGVLYNLPSDRQVLVDCEFKLFRPSDRELARCAVTRFSEIASVQRHVFPSGHVGTVTMRESADQRTVIFKDENGHLHNEDAPAVMRILKSSGETIHAAWSHHGKEMPVDEPQSVPAAP